MRSSATSLEISRERDVACPRFLPRVSLLGTVALINDNNRRQSCRFAIVPSIAAAITRSRRRKGKRKNVSSSFSRRKKNRDNASGLRESRYSTIVNQGESCFKWNTCDVRVDML